ncbi:hypothetical protein K7X08_011082 [Anisodus acutangulus]|uniref:Uncharacterized protein n=1 Tax=Anisodus acutangulus TaxID=402998 RepID=A0A9Q1M1H6_9SOLA|nr:hypothetical protein K7X08_011082 [Anisodus acutangulus]
MKLTSETGHERDHDEDQVQVQCQDLGGIAKETCSHCGRDTIIITNRLTLIEDEFVSFSKLLEKKSRRRSKYIFSSVRSSRKMIRKALQFPNAKKTKVNTLDGYPLSHPDHIDDAHDGPSSPLPNQVDDESCKTLLLPDPAHDVPSSPLTGHVHNNDGHSSPLPDQVDDASCKTLSGDVADSVVDNDDRITDVLAHIHDKYDIEEFGDAAQNGY